jgi:hypothetical protein
MSFKYWMLCIVLFIIILFFANKSYVMLTHPSELIPDKKPAGKSEARTENSSATVVVTKPTFAASHNLIAEKNIFNPERKDFQGTGPGSASKSVIRPEVILYGITIAGNYQSASLVNPGRSLKKGERDLMTLKLGERIGEYKLTKVLSDRITLEAQGDTFEVFLYDPKVPKKREGGLPRAPSSASTPTGTPRPFARREGTKGTKELAQETTSPSQIPSPIPTPTQIPAPMTPTPILPSFTPTLAAPPPGMGQSVPIPPGTGQPIPVPPGMGKPIPLPSGVPTQPPSSGGN